MLRRLAIVSILLFTFIPVFAGDTVVYLVRHAEKVDASRDPALSQAGHDRAQGIARMLRSAGIERIHSSDFRRTLDTAAPLARELGLEVRVYDPRKLEGIAERLRAGSGVHLVVGHSNTTPQLVRLLGGEAVDMDESVYDRLYRVTRRGDTVETLLLHTQAICDGAAMSE